MLALTRAVPAAIDRCELTHLARQPIDYMRAVAEHEAYEDALRRAGCTVERVAAAPDLPDSVFVEDAAVVIDGLAVIARPGAASRRPETASVAAALSRHRPLAFIESPATLDGGDVLVIPGRVFVGISGRTNSEGARQLASLLAPHGYETTAVPLGGCLHLKSAVTMAGPGLLVINPGWIDRTFFAGVDLVDVDPTEPAAANVLRVGDVTLCAAAHPRTRERLESRGLAAVALDAGELAKAEGGLTCGFPDISRLIESKPSYPLDPIQRS